MGLNGGGPSGAGAGGSQALVRLTLTAPAGDREALLAEACELLGAGCREGEGPDGELQLDFWLAAQRSPAPEQVERAMAQRGHPVSARAEPESDDWKDAMRAFHKPVEIAGRLLVRPPWTEPRPGFADVVIDPGMAFGTGQHATTRGCLTLLADLPPARFVDAGCGSGVLGIAARRLGHDPVAAFDDDPLAVDATIANARANGVALEVSRRSIGVDRLPPMAGACLAANLTATVIAVLAGAAITVADPPARAILSGLRLHETAGALAAVAPLGLSETGRIEQDGWAALLVEG